jgi:hypothetical protein
MKLVWHRFGNLSAGFIFVAVLLTSAFSSCLAQEGGGDPTPNAESKWRELITVSITSPTATTYLYVNQSLTYTASATCIDQFSNDGGTTWHYYSADTTGPSPTINWTATYGTFSSATGASTTYYAPNGSSVYWQIFDSISAHATTTGNDIYGSPPATATAPSTEPATQPVSQVQVTCNQTAGAVAGNYAGTLTIPANFGGAGNSGHIGSMTPGVPLAAVDGYYGGTELKAVRVNGNYSYATMAWTQTQGLKHAIAFNNGAMPALSVDLPPGSPDITANVTLTHGTPPNDATGPLYLFDAPGWPCGVANNAGIGDAPPGNWTGLQYQQNFSTYVVDSHSNQISNACTWSVAFTVGIDPATGNTWKLAGAHTP